MTNSMVSVRVPVSLVEELKEVSKKDHFLDLSDAVRSIVRDNWTKHKNPAAQQIKELRKEIADNLNKRNNEELISELKKIRDSILENKDEENK